MSLPKSGYDIECKLADDDESQWKRMKVVSIADKFTGVNKHIMNVAFN